ncbi:DNA-processing protein DprA [Ferruginibacter sp. HRS2-29]|uniref:DNA-processing protein DprA n=1 Tax=Ferruginibacter sp. HRS2-29 TaxID=2487334 RepID=UPI0020CD1320|nr:DNA-processing protein DprA [Ferruginibacter sp. HRS2-29]MCP9753301.1 DNA-protecting protein DprA [Ferruginibacter sp. HRS2-29]
MNNELLYQLALTLTPNIGDVHSKTLISIYGNASDIFKAPMHQLEKIEGIGRIRARSIKSFTDLSACEEEIRFLEKEKIIPIFITEEMYPQRLLNCYDSPPLLFFKGNTNLNAGKIVSIVGTRSNSEYGRQMCERMVEELRQQNVTVVSGLAFGIDTIAHRAALKNNLPTIGVLAHGLDRIYPSQNHSLAREMQEYGGLLTDFRSGTSPDRQNFPRRNRIVAGICDALIVIESNRRGGSLITAEIAASYNKDLFAIPGRVNDIKSEGCNYLIKNNKATMITSSDDIFLEMNWMPKTRPAKKQQRELFIEFSQSEKIILTILQESPPLQLDEIYRRSGLGSGIVAEALLMLEMQGIVESLPGKKYKLN